MNLVFETWREKGGGVTVCLAGPDGDGARALLDKSARLVRVFEAGSHFEAMTLHYAAMGWGQYTTNQDWDLTPFPEEWFARQQATARTWRAFHTLARSESERQS